MNKPLHLDLTHATGCEHPKLKFKCAVSEEHMVLVMMKIVIKFMKEHGK
jgi:hypothetical protein